ncbi:MAG: PHP domain-containing protein [Christensenellaceae bacterium]|nr:PHP domain-containing protein [Christensenellaceae bacterium]
MAACCDLHIHSCLSPCADDDMTPWNLVGMARVKGLDVIALTDHNTARNTPEAMAAGEAYGVQVIPGMRSPAGRRCTSWAIFPPCRRHSQRGKLSMPTCRRCKTSRPCLATRSSSERMTVPPGRWKSCSLTPRTSAWKRSVRLSAPLGACLYLRISTAAATA